MSTSSTPDLSQAAAINPNVDYEVLRAQLVNCINVATTLLQQHNEGLSAFCVFTRFMNLGVLFNLQSNRLETRRYILRLTSPDGIRAHFIRLDAEGAEVLLDDIDNAYMNAIGHCMEDTVHAAWKQMAPVVPATTHSSTITLH